MAAILKIVFWLYFTDLFSIQHQSKTRHNTWSDPKISLFFLFNCLPYLVNKDEYKVTH